MTRTLAEWLAWSRALRAVLPPVDPEADRPPLVRPAGTPQPVTRRGGPVRVRLG